MNQLLLLYRLICRPLVREPFRTALTVACVALGVAVVVAIDLAGAASVGSFESSLESLQDTADFEISQVGGIPDAVFGDLVRLPGPQRFSPRIEGYAVVESTGERLPLFGVDLVGDQRALGSIDLAKPSVGAFDDERVIWISASIGPQAGEQIDLAINDQVESFTVLGLLGGQDGGEEALTSMVVMDIALAQRLLDRTGILDRIYVHVPNDDRTDWKALLKDHLPAAALVSDAGTRTQQNRKLLSSFRWNLRVLSYIALIVGAFLIYNTISVSVVRRRIQIGTARALGMPARTIQWGFLAEAGLFGLLGTLAGLVLGRALAVGAVDLMGRTVATLYVGSQPGEIVFRPWAVAVAGLAGIGVSVLAAWWPAREASSVAPVEAMARGREEYAVAATRTVWAKRAALLAVLAVGLCLVPAWDRLSYGGFAAALCLIAAAAMLVPFAARFCLRRVAGPMLRLLGAAPMLGVQILSQSLKRTSVIVAAMAVATAMMVSVGIMVGSLRDTLAVWMGNQLQADLYIRSGESLGTEDSATFSEEVASLVEALPEVDVVDRFRRYSIRYGGLPANLALADFRVHPGRSQMQILHGPDIPTLAEQLVSTKSVIISEPFSSKHGLGVGSTVALPIGDGAEEFEVVAVYYDYSAEQGYVIGHRQVLMEYLPDQQLTSAAVYLVDGADLEAARSSLIRAVAGRRVRVARNRELRERANEVFDRTFAITYALEAVAILVAILGMAGALLTLVIDRKTDLGVLRILGATKKQVRKLVLAQAGLLGLISNMIGLVLGGALSVILIKVINKQSFGWTIQFHWPVGLLLAATTLIFVASVIAGLYPARIGGGLDPVEVLHEG
jgi:putative ABC transport system permease protein